MLPQEGGNLSINNIFGNNERDTSINTSKTIYVTDNPYENYGQNLTIHKAFMNPWTLITNL